MKRIIYSVTLLIIAISGFSQVIVIKDRETLRPLEFATLHCLGTDIYAVSNLKGKLNLSEFSSCNQIEVRMMGYETIVTDYEKIVNLGLRIYLEQSSITLDQVVISASKWQQSQRNVPIKISALTAKEIMFKSAQTSADLIGSSGEVFVQKSQQGGGSPMIRGFATNRVLISVDGVRMNNAIFRSGNLQNIISIDPFSVEKTEVLFGPGSVIYGSDAIGGVMSFTSLKPKFSENDSLSFSGSAALRGSTANSEMTGHFDFNIGLKNLAFLTSVSYNDYGDLRMGAFGPEEYLCNFFVRRLNDTLDLAVNNPNPLVQTTSGYDQKNLMQKIAFSPSEKLEFNYSFMYSETSDYSRYDRLVLTRNGLPRSAEWYYGPQIWMMNNFSMESKQNSTVYDNVIFRLAHQHFKESRHDRDFNNPILRNRYERVEALSLNLDFIKHFSDKDEFTYGVEAVYNNVNSTGSNINILSKEEVTAPARYPQSDWHSYAIYGTYKHQLNEKTDLLGGLRYNHYYLKADFDTSFYPFPFTSAVINDGALSGSLGLVYNPNQKWSLSVNASTGFRSPNVDDMGKVFDSEPGSVVVPNPDLKAEYAYNGEISIGKVFGESVKLIATAYYIYLDNALVRRDFLLNGMDSIDYNGELSRIQAVQNAAFAQVYGAQAAIDIKFAYGFGINSRFNYQKGNEETDDGNISPLRHAAPWFGRTSLTYSFEKIRMEFYSLYSGEVSFENMPDEERSKSYLYALDVDGNPFSPRWLTYNFKIAYQLNENISFNMAVENITDLRYRPYSSGIVASGRNIQVGVRAFF